MYFLIVLFTVFINYKKSIEAIPLNLNLKSAKVNNNELRCGRNEIFYQNVDCARTSCDFWEFIDDNIILVRKMKKDWPKQYQEICLDSKIKNKKRVTRSSCDCKNDYVRDKKGRCRPARRVCPAIIREKREAYDVLANSTMTTTTAKIQTTESEFDLGITDAELRVTMEPDSTQSSSASSVIFGFLLWLLLIT